jgi:F-type H+-transporting ATPase subunit b
VVSAPRPSPHDLERLDKTVTLLTISASLASLAPGGGHAVKDPPLIDIDGTVFIQLGVFVITAFVLSRFFFRPFLAMRAARAEGIDGARAEAARMDDEARARVTDYDARYAEAKTRAGKERTVVRTEAAERERAISEAVRKETESAVAAARQKLGTDAEKARAELAPRASELGRSIAKKILGREVA